MAVLRINKTENYTVMSNYHFKEKEMSLKAKGLLSQMLSLPDDWDYSIAGLVKINKENETAIKSTLNELKAFGYLKVTKVMPNESKTGRIEYIYDVFEEPKQELRNLENNSKKSKKSTVKKQNVEKQEQEKQGVENLGVENQHIENQVQLNTNKLNIKELNTNNKILRDNISSKAADEISSYEFNILKNEFEDLWSKYPKKRGKKEAFEIYCKYRKATNEGYITKDDVEDGIEQYNRYIKAYAIEDKYIKYGSTFFEERAWEDDYEIDNQKAGFIDWLEAHQYGKLA